MDTITTTLKREWFAKIVDGSKRVEYREIKPFPVLTVRIDMIVPSPRGRVRSGDCARSPFDCWTSHR